MPLSPELLGSLGTGPRQRGGDGFLGGFWVEEATFAAMESSLEERVNECLLLEDVGTWEGVEDLGAGSAAVVPPRPRTIFGGGIAPLGTAGAR